MASQVTETVSINGFKNLWTQAQADGYTGTPIIREGTVLNFNSTVAYLHLHTTGATNPTTGADGLPIGTDSATAPAAGFTLPEGTDITTVWIFTSGAQNIKYAIIGR